MWLLLKLQLTQTKEINLLSGIILFSCTIQTSDRIQICGGRTNTTTATTFTAQTYNLDVEPHAGPGVHSPVVYPDLSRFHVEELHSVFDSDLLA